MIDYRNLEELDKAGHYLVQVLVCTLYGREVPPPPASLEWELLYRLARMHSIDSMVFAGVQDQLPKEGPLYSRWKKTRDQNLVQAIVQEEEAKTLFRCFSREKIRYLPLKGFEMRQLYPDPGFRQMADIDILIDPQNAPKVRAIMKKLGYTLRSYGVIHDDEYFKAPYITVEIHRQVHLKGNPKQAYYDAVWERTVPDEIFPGARRLRPEDNYVYLVAHFEKHYSRTGTGIRPVLDLYLYRKHFQDRMDRAYIEKELRELHLLSFCQKLEALSEYWFSDSPAKKAPFPPEELHHLERGLYLAGIYGSREFYKSKMMEEIHVEKGILPTLSYLRKRIFLSPENMKHPSNYPFLRKYPFLLPFCWIHRLFHALIHKRGAVQREMELFQEKSRQEDTGSR